MNVNIGYPFELVEAGGAFACHSCLTEPADMADEGCDMCKDNEGSFTYTVTIDGYEVWRDDNACYSRPEQTIQAFAAKLKEVLT